MGSTSREYARFLAYGHQLIEIHVGLRDMLDDLRSGLVPDADLGTHCRAFCAAVTRHHTGEDTHVFPLLAERHPGLRDFLAGLERDHEVIAGMLTRVTALSRQLGGGLASAPAAELQQELDGLAAVLETHFIGEEKRLVTVLNALHPAGGPTGLTA